MKIKEDQSHVYGELTLPSIMKLAEYMRKNLKQSFLDIGSGYGLITRGVDEYYRDTSIPKKIRGIERDLERVKICNKIDTTKDKYREHDRYKIIHGDIYDHLYLIKEADFIFSNSLLFPSRFAERVAANMKPRSIFIHNTTKSKVTNKAPLFLSTTWNHKGMFKVYVKE